MEAVQVELMNRLNWRRGVYRLLTALSILWIAAITLYAAIAVTWQTDSKVMRASYERVQWHLIGCAPECDDIASKVKIAQQDKKDFVPVLQMVFAELDARVKHEQKKITIENAQSLVLANTRFIDVLKVVASENLASRFVENVEAERKARNESVIVLILLALIPIFFAFAAIEVIAWVLRGFNKREAIDK
jgi:hypothetical protein